MAVAMAGAGAGAEAVSIHIARAGETGGAVIAAVHARALSNAQAARAGERRVCPHRESSYDGGAALESSCQSCELLCVPRFSPPPLHGSAHRRAGSMMRRCSRKASIPFDVDEQLG
eukprot:scaffold50593_cov37-Phaeocystis_antarctica.AAC.1